VVIRPDSVTTAEATSRVHSHTAQPFQRRISVPANADSKRR
jgi:hypothetical protein